MTAIQTGVTPSGRILAPVMPWHAYAGLTKSDAGAIVDYLKTCRRLTTKFPVRSVQTKNRQYTPSRSCRRDNTTQHN